MSDHSECCDRACRIILQEGETMVKADGECTKLYWHMSNCEECADRLSSALGIPKDH